MTRHRRHGGGRRADPDKQACDRWLMETIIKAPYIRPPDHPLGSNLAEVRAYYHAAREAAPEGVKSMWAEVAVRMAEARVAEDRDIVTPSRPRPPRPSATNKDGSRRLSPAESAALSPEERRARKLLLTRLSNQRARERSEPRRP
jgi:hypothetical protein